jgi:hypothetical protein
MTDTTSMAENRTLPRRQPNAAYRQREYLTETEVERLIEAARKRGRNSTRDSAAILLAYRHGLRARVVFAALVSSRSAPWTTAREPRQGRDRECSPTAWARAKSAAPITGQFAVCVRHRGWHASNNSLVLANGSTNRGSRQASLPCPSAHAAPFDRIQARQRWPRHAFAGALSRPSQFAVYRKVYRASPRPVCEVLEGLGGPARHDMTRGSTSWLRLVYCRWPVACSLRSTPSRVRRSAT